MGQLINIFGSRDRIQKLQNHLHTIRNRGDVRIVILSSTRSDIIAEALRRVELNSYIDLIICSNDKSKLQHICTLKQQNNLSRQDEILYVDIKCDEKEIQNECTAYLIDISKSKPMFGPSPADLDHIECIIYNKQYIPHVITRETEIHPKEQPWLSAHILKELLKSKSNTNDPGLWRIYGKSLSLLRHVQDADYAYKKSLDIAPNIFKTRLSCGFHYLNHEQFRKAKDTFYVALRIYEQRMKLKITVNLCAGLARSLYKLNELKQAEHYFVLGTNISMNRFENFEPIHFYYGCFLMENGRFEEAKEQFDICLRCSPYKPINHYHLAQVLYELKDFEQFGFVLNQALRLDPHYALGAKLKKYHEENMKQSSRIKTMKKFGQSSNCGNSAKSKQRENIHDKGSSLSSLSINNRNRCQVEFDKFWFDMLGITTQIFNGYYDRFVEHGLDDIQYLLFNRDVHEDLQNKIGISNSIHSDVIWNRIKDLRRSHQEFEAWLEQNNLKKYGNIFIEYGIYSLNALINTEKHKDSIENPVDSGVIEHAIQLLSAT